MGRALILRVYIRHLQKPAAIIIFYSNVLDYHIDGLLSLTFCSERGAAIESAIEAPKITASEHGTRQRTLEVVLHSGESLKSVSLFSVAYFEFVSKKAGSIERNPRNHFPVAHMISIRKP